MSFSSSVFDPDGNLLKNGSDLEVVGRFEGSRTFWALLFSQVPLSARWDLTPFLNQQLRAHDGVAIVNLEFEQSAAPHLMHYFLAPLLVVPAATSVTVRGDVVRVRQKETSPADAEPSGPVAADSPRAEPQGH